MKDFWKGLEGVPGIGVIYPRDEGSNKAGWYASRFHYDAAAFGGISNVTFCDALNAEVGGGFSFGCNMPLHLSSVFFDEDVYGHGRPTGRAFLPEGVDPRAESGELPNAERVNARVLGEPWFKHCDPALIDPYVEAVRKVAKYAAEELQEVNDTEPILGGVALSRRRK